MTHTPESLHVGNGAVYPKNHAICQGPAIVATAIGNGYQGGWAPSSENWARALVDAFNATYAAGINPDAVPDMRAKLEKVAAWLDRLTAHNKQRAAKTDYITLKEACEADAKNFGATAKDIRATLAKAKEIQL